ncbi:MAG: hypothetical protein AAF802_04200 [Planctomycetota bacterium]
MRRQTDYVEIPSARGVQILWKNRHNPVMKMDRHHHDEPHNLGKPRFTIMDDSRFRRVIMLLFAAFIVLWPSHLTCATGPSQAASSDSKPLDDPAAHKVLRQVIERLAFGESFDCKVRQRVHTTGREVIGAGTGSYLQVGGGTSQFSFRMTLHDGVSQHTLQQISDGRLAWTRREISEAVTLSRVDVGWLDEGARLSSTAERIRPSMLIGGPAEMLDVISRDFDLRLGTSLLDERKLFVVMGDLKPSKREQIHGMLGGRAWPEYLPTRVNVAIAQEDDPETSFGRGLPVRIEHWSDPLEDEGGSTHDQSLRRRMISLLEFYSIKPIKPPPVERFRFENQDAEIDFVNETNRYENRFGVRVSAVPDSSLR